MIIIDVNLFMIFFFTLLCCSSWSSLFAMQIKTHFLVSALLKQKNPKITSGFSLQNPKRWNLSHIGHNRKFQSLRTFSSLFFIFSIKEWICFQNHHPIMIIPPPPLQHHPPPPPVLPPLPPHQAGTRIRKGEIGTRFVNTSGTTGRRWLFRCAAALTCWNSSGT